MNPLAPAIMGGLCCLGLSAVGCKKTEQPQAGTSAAPELAAEASGTGSVAPAPGAGVPEKSAPEQQEPLPAGPASAEAKIAKEERERAVFALLSGGPAAEALPLYDLDPDKDFDPNLRDQIAPRRPAPPLKLTLRALNVTGSLPKEVVQRVVRQRYGRFRLCYQDGLEKDPKLGGELEFRFTIDAKGTVTNASLSSPSFPDASVAECVLQQVRKIQFPETDAGAITVDYSMSFAPY